MNALNPRRLGRVLPFCSRTINTNTTLGHREGSMPLLMSLEERYTTHNGRGEVGREEMEVNTKIAFLLIQRRKALNSGVHSKCKRATLCNFD